MKRTRKVLFVVFGMALGGVAAGALWLRQGLAPMPVQPPQYFHLDHPQVLGLTLKELADRQVVKNPAALRVYGWLHRAPRTVRAGTYQIKAGMTADEILEAMRSPIHQNFRFPETNWARRNANLLQKADVTTAKDYLALVNNPAQFQTDVDFPLPSKTLEGYLYPDTYDLPPLTGAKPVVERQLRAFETKVVKPLGPAAASDVVIRKASLVELEAGTDADRAEIAGVIDNRLKKGMALQIDAGIMYSLGKWRRLFFKDYKNVKSPYNLYLHKGLPPTPICSPSYKSIEAVLHPANHDYLYYVALPNGHSIFAKTPAQHEHNIKLRKQALLERKKERELLKDLLSPKDLSTDQKDMQLPKVKR